MQGLEFEPRRAWHKSKDVEKEATAALDPQPESGVIPRDSVFGIHTVNEYTMSGRRRVNKHYKHKKGEHERVTSFLAENPIVALPVPISPDDRDPRELTTNVPSRIALLEGNNRVRYAPSFVQEFPALFVTGEQGSALLELAVDEVYGVVDDWIDEALIDFASHNPNMTRPFDSVLERHNNGLLVVTRAPKETVLFSGNAVELVSA